MKKILGLDLGTTSIGWAMILESDNETEQSSIIDAGVRVTPLTNDEQDYINKGKSITSASERTLKHGARLNLHRYKMRRANLIAILKENDIINDNTLLAETGKGSTHETIRLRARAATERVDLTDFARILLSINKKRGYKSNRKASGENNEGPAIDSMSVARKLFDRNITPGQYALELLHSGKKLIPEFYRSDLEHEFELIYRTQQRFNPLLDDELLKQITGKNGKTTWAILANTLGLNGIKRTTKGIEQKIEDYTWRVKALTEPIGSEQLATVLEKINAGITASSGLLSAISDRSKNLIINKMTVAQYLWSELSRDPHFSTRNMVFYRKDYLDEFNKIWDTQAKFYPQLTDALKEEVRDVIIFYQRRLKSQKNNVAYCEFESKVIDVEIDGINRKKTIGLRVAPKSSPIFQEFKILQKINNLRVSGRGNEHLNADERRRLFEELNISETLSQKDILKLLDAPVKGLELNFSEIDGNVTNYKLIKKYLDIVDASGHDATAIAKLPAKEKLRAIARIFESIGINPAILDFDSSAPGKEFEK